MKTNFKQKNYLLLYFVIIILLFITSEIFSKTKNNNNNNEQKKCVNEEYFIDKQKAHGRIDMLKKIKLLETLELDTNNSEKFLSIYSFFEKQIMKHSVEINTLKKELEKEIKNNNINSAKINADKLIALQQEINNLTIERQNKLKESLDTLNFAKYILFENTFCNKINETVLQHKKFFNFNEEKLNNLIIHPNKHKKSDKHNKKDKYKKSYKYKKNDKYKN